MTGSMGKQFAAGFSISCIVAIPSWGAIILRAKIAILSTAYLWSMEEVIVVHEGRYTRR